MLRMLPKRGRPRTKGMITQNVTLRGFGGGLNYAFDDLSMPGKFLVTLSNFRRTASGSQKVRWGTKYFADVTSVLVRPASHIVDMEYFGARIICVMDSGEIVTLDAIGAMQLIWSDAIAAALPGAPSMWTGGVDTVDFAPNKNDMIIHNGKDKPITINGSFQVTYLQDLATGSNVNVPVGKYGTTATNYHCVAGVPAQPTVVYISSKGTAGTFPLDPAPNDAISIDVGAYASEGAPEIRGIAGFRQYLIVFFRTQSVLVVLGQYDAAGNHTPQFPDTMPKFGLLGHRTLVSVEQDLFFADNEGMASAKRNLFGLVDSSYHSDMIEPSYRRIVGGLTEEQVLKEVFTIRDDLSKDTIFIMPTGDAFVFSSSDKLKYSSWSQFAGMNWTCGCATQQGRVFYAKGMRVFQQGNGVFDDEDYAADRMLDRDTVWMPNTVFDTNSKVFDPVSAMTYIALQPHKSGPGTFQDDVEGNSALWAVYEGEPIDFTFELPWLDGKDPMRLKQLRFFSASSKGTAKFKLRAWVDNLFKDPDGALAYDPALEMDFIGNDAQGFGYDAGPFGGGRRSNDPRLWKFPVKFKLLKVIMTGSVRKPLTIVTLSYMFSYGKHGR